MARVAGVAGLSGALIIIAGSVATAIAYVGSAGEAFSPLDHWISELGELANSELAAVFNVALVVGGLEFVVLMVGLMRAVPGPLPRIAAALGMVGGVCGAMVGVFPMDRLGTHTLVAFGFFGLTCVSIAIFALSGRPAGPTAGRPAIAAAIVIVASLVAFLAVVLGGGAGDLSAPDPRPTFWLPSILEWLALIGLLGWVLIVSLRLFRETDSSR